MLWEVSSNPFYTCEKVINKPCDFCHPSDVLLLVLIILICVNADAAKTGAAQEAMQNTVRRASRAITEQEARQILGVTENAAWEEILKVNAGFPSFLLLVWVSFLSLFLIIDHLTVYAFFIIHAEIRCFVREEC